MEDAKQTVSIREETGHSQLKQFGRLFLPSWAEFGVYTVLSLIMLVFGSFTVIRSWLGIGNDTLQLSELVPFTVNQSSVMPSLATALFWSGVGSVVYILMWLVSNMLIAVRNDVVAVEDFIKPTHAPKVQSARFEFIESMLLRLAALVAIVGFSVITISILLPLYLGMFRSAVLHWQDITRLLDGAIGLLGLAVVFHFFVVLVRLLLLRVRIFS